MQRTHNKSTLKHVTKYKTYYGILAFVIFIPLILYAFYLGTTSARLGEVNFFNDVARDFLLFHEMDAKKLVLIGARSSTTGVYNGSLWTYINYPAYLLGNGNPVFQLWFWAFLGVLSVISGFFVAKKLFGTLAGLFMALLMTLRLVPYLNGFIHAYASFFVMPLYVYAIAQYVKTKNAWYLALFMLLLAMLVQFNIGTGIAFVLLSIPLVIFLIIKRRTWKHILALFVLPLALSNYILFELKNGLRMTKALTQTGQGTTFFVYFPEWVQDRINHFYQMELLEHIPNMWSQGVMLLICIVIFVASILEIKNNKKKRYLYVLFFYFYLGYFALSYFNKGLLLFHYVYFLVPLTTLWLLSFFQSKYKYVFIGIAIIAVIYNFLPAQNFSDYMKGGGFATNPNSWKSLSMAATEVLKKQKGEEFGYFVFAPDSFAYQPRYAMLYHFRNNGGREYTKLKTTWIIAQPAPAKYPYMNYTWWVKTPVKIDKKEVFKDTLPNNYTILKYELTPDEQKVLHDKSIELGIHFR